MQGKKRIYLFVFPHKFTSRPENSFLSEQIFGRRRIHKMFIFTQTHTIIMVLWPPPCLPHIQQKLHQRRRRRRHHDDEIFKFYIFTYSHIEFVCWTHGVLVCVLCVYFNCSLHIHICIEQIKMHLMFMWYTFGCHHHHHHHVTSHQNRYHHYRRHQSEYFTFFSVCFQNSLNRSKYRWYGAQKLVTLKSHQIAHICMP